MYRPDASYLTGWSSGNDLILVRRNEDGNRVRDRVPFRWYFLISDADHAKISDDAWACWKRRGWVESVERDEFPSWWRVYVDNPARPMDVSAVHGRRDITDLSSRWCEPFTKPEPSRAFRFPKSRGSWSPLHNIVHRLEGLDVEPLEADLSPLRRFLIDNDVDVMADCNVCFLDFETDDRRNISEKEKSRILSVAWEGSDGGEGFLLLEDDTDAAERALLAEFVRELKAYDMLAAWNGDGFDFPMLIARSRAAGLRVNWRQWLWADPLPVFRKRFIRQQVTSYKLDDVGQKVLGIKKVDWRDEFRERFPKVPLKVWHLWQHDCELLERYNRRDVEILRKLEEKTRFLEVERLQNKVAGIFSGDFTVSNKIDTMILRRGKRAGHHFRTRHWVMKGDDKFVGAFVFEPSIGVHSNVGVFDFKSLYPSIIRSFNISPETFVRERDREMFDPASICTCPVVETDSGKRGGATYRIDEVGLVSQMFVDTTDRRNEYTRRKDARIEECGTKDDPEVKLCENLAYAFKSLGLSFYGEMGHSTGRYYDVEMAESITLSGQHFIKRTEEFAAELGYRVLAGDTDSIFIQLIRDDEHVEDRAAEMLRRGAELMEHCQSKYSSLLSEFNCRPEWNAVQLEFEDVYDRIVFVAKKRYAGRMLVHKGKRTDHVEVKGLELMRSDCTSVTRDLQRRVLDAVLVEGADPDRASEIVEAERERCMSGSLGPEEVVISKSISKDPDDYKTFPIHVKLAKELKERTSDFYIGMKIGYVVTGKCGSALDGVLAEMYDPAAMGYSAEYYWDKIIWPATHRILQVCFPEHDWKKHSIKDSRRRMTLIERYTKWADDPKKADRAVEKAVENKGGYLRNCDIENILKKAEELREGRRADSTQGEGGQVRVREGEAVGG